MKYLPKILYLFALIQLLGPSASAQTFPKPVGNVNDFANIIPSSDKQRMDGLIYELKKKTGAEIAVVTMPDIGGEEYTDYANRLYEAWGLGQKGQDNGILIFLTHKERKIRIEVGYGLEGILPDGKVGGILDEYVIPLLQQDKFGQGLYNATAVVAATIAEDAGVTLTGEQPSQRSSRRYRRSGGLGSILLLLFIFLLFGRRMGFLPMLFLGSMMMGGGRRYGGFGGGFGSGGGFGGFGGGLSGGGGAGRGF